MKAPLFFCLLFVVAAVGVPSPDCAGEVPVGSPCSTDASFCGVGSCAASGECVVVRACVALHHTDVSYLVAALATAVSFGLFAVMALAAAFLEATSVGSEPA